MGPRPSHRPVLLDEFETDDGYAFVPCRPLFLAAGERVELTGDRAEIVRSDGSRRAVEGSWETRCGSGVRRR
ncbi:hypothetical protein AMK19_06330 [Kitasatospora sp. CB01950]|nr:hypothetical protein AMK19_06330 [Kitasatospora sp. CB01950]